MTNEQLEAYRKLARKRLGKSDENQDENKPKRYYFGRDYVKPAGSQIDFNELFEGAPKHLQKQLRNIAFKARKEVFERKDKSVSRKEHFRVEAARIRARRHLQYLKQLDQNGHQEQMGVSEKD